MVKWCCASFFFALFGDRVGSDEAEGRGVVVCVFLCVNDANRPAFDGNARVTLTTLMLDIRGTETLDAQD
jgi:hypothetical protein